MTNPKDIDVGKYRKATVEIDGLFLRRWSPRAMSGESISEKELMALFEAARWAPSSINEQPWRFIYAKRETKYWETFYNLLSDGNKIWCKNAAVLVVIASKKRFTSRDSDNRTHSFSAGSAFENLALQGTIMGLIVHGMGGFDEDRAQKELSIPDGYFVNAMVAIGRQGNIEDLDEKTRSREFPSDRKPINETVSEGIFKG